LKVDIHRDGVRLTTTTNDGTYTDKVGKTGGPYTYKVCEAGTNTCSNEATINS
jgi:thermitase